MKKLWKKYRILGYKGEPRRDIAWKLLSLQRDLGHVEKSDFPELAGMEDDESEDDQEWNGTSEEIEFTDEWSEEEKQAHREEKAEHNDWFKN